MTQQVDSISLLVIGGTNTGKTHYGAQLLGRLNHQRGRLRMDAVAANIEPFEEALQRLAQGCTAGHTPTQVYRESIWPVRTADGRTYARLLWPDYGGEQVRHILDERRIDQPWQNRIRESSGWLLFIRPDRVRSYEDVLRRPRAQALMAQDIQGSSDVSESMTPEEAQWTDQARLVELLQVLLFVKQVGTVTRIQSPALNIILSCWDEIAGAAEDVRPAEFLRQRLPLLYSFVAANWYSDTWSVFGLSSLGKALKPDEADADYIDRGPETQGWVVLPDGSCAEDLTVPVERLMELIVRQ